MTPFISSSQHTCINSRRAVLASHQYAHIEQGTPLQIYEVFNLPVPHSNLSAQCKITHRYIRVTYDETKAVAITYQ